MKIVQPVYSVGIIIDGGKYCEGRESTVTSKIQAKNV